MTPPVSSAVSRYRWFTDFLGPKTCRLLALGALAGLGLFVAEAAFAYALQAFLRNLGVLGPSAVALPIWMANLSIRGVLGLVFLVGTVRGLLIGTQSWMQGTANEELTHRARAQLLEWTFRSESVSTSKISALFNSRTISAGFAVASFQTLVVQATAALLLGASLLVMAPAMTLLVIAALLLIAWPLRFADRGIKAAGEGLRSQWDKTNTRLLRSIKNLLLLQIYGTLNDEESRAQDNLRAYRDHAIQYYFLTGVKYAVPQILGVLLICLIAVFARSLGNIRTGLLVSYFYLMLRFLQIFTSINQSISGIVLHWPQLNDLYLWWKEQASGPENTRPASTKELPAPFVELVGWKLSGLDFAYPGGEGQVISDLSLLIEPGKTLVIRGPSGVGKSTLLSLMLGGLKPSRGSVEVLLNGGRTQNLEECRPKLLQSIGYVGSESFLIEGTIAQNITYGLAREPSPAEIKDAIEKAECHFIYALPQGLEHALTEQGQGLSGGQKQRLSLVRALLRRPKVLILDEATSNLDHETESKIVSTLAHLKAQMTIIAVTHRQELMRISDQCLTLERRGA